jgi:hypothetical protein
MNNLAPRSNRAPQSGQTGLAAPGQIDGPLQVERLMDLAFFPGRAPRSAEYRQGCQAALEYRILARRMHAPYPAGCSEADAWFAGVEEGHAIWRRKCEAAAGQDSSKVPS